MRTSAILAGAALAACSKRAAPTSPHDAPATPATPLEGGATAADATHLLNRLAFGPAPGQVDAVVKTGLGAWLDAQLRPATVADPAGDAALAPFAHALAPADELQDATALEAQAMVDDGEAPADKKAQNMAKRELVLATQMTAIARHIASERQLHEVMTDFWTNHFSVSLQKGKVRFLAADFVEHAVRPHALGRFVELLQATARHPAMLVYLDNAQSVLGGSVRGGKVIGAFPGLAEDQRFEGRDLAIATDTRDLLADVLAGTLGLRSELATIFPDHAVKPVGVI